MMGTLRMPDFITNAKTRQRRDNEKDKGKEKNKDNTMAKIRQDQ